MQRYYIELDHRFPDGTHYAVKLDEFETGDREKARRRCRELAATYPPGHVKLFQETRIVVEVPLGDDVPPPMPAN